MVSLSDEYIIKGITQGDEESFISLNENIIKFLGGWFNE